MVIPSNISIPSYHIQLQLTLGSWSWTLLASSMLFLCAHRNHGQLNLCNKPSMSKTGGNGGNHTFSFFGAALKSGVCCVWTEANCPDIKKNHPTTGINYLSIIFGAYSTMVFNKDHPKDSEPNHTKTAPGASNFGSSWPASEVACCHGESPLKVQKFENWTMKLVKNNGIQLDSMGWYSMIFNDIWWHLIIFNEIQWRLLVCSWIYFNWI